MSKSFLIIHTGGTISMEADIHNRVQQSEAGHPLMNAVKTANYTLQETLLFNIPSPYMTTDKMLELGNFIYQQKDLYDGILITHGTDTLEETAYFLDLYVNINQPIVLTGAMRSNNELSADGIFNVKTALHLLNHMDLEGQTLVVMNGEIHLPKEVYKSSSVQLNSFKSLYGPVGLVQPNHLQWVRNIEATNASSKQIKQLTKKVNLLKIHTALNQTFLQSFFELPFDGLVIEAYGQGNIPDFIVPFCQVVREKKIPIAITSRTIDGIVRPTYNYPGGAAHIQELDVIFANHLSSQKACIQLLLGLENNYNLKDYFEFKTV